MQEKKTVSLSTFYDSQVITMLRKCNMNNLAIDIILWSSIKKHNIILNKFKECFWTKNGNKQGLYKSWYGDGQIFEECFYIANQREGIYKCHWGNGQIQEECFYSKCKLEGPYKSWNINGPKFEEKNYSEGKLEGSYKRWHINGEIMCDRLYSKGLIKRSSDLY